MQGATFSPRPKRGRPKETRTRLIAAAAECFNEHGINGVDASRIAIWKAADAGLSLAGSAVGSDAFFPFADGLIAAAEAGATCAIQPGGSVRDEEVIAAANERKMAMICTGVRHFRH